MSNLIPIDNKRAGLAAPQRMRDRMQAGTAMGGNFTSGLQGGFVVLSIRGSRFHLRYGKDNETTILDPSTGAAAGVLDVVLIDASKTLAKTFYANNYAQGSADMPDCWSLDSVRPDPSVPNKVNPTCQDCEMNRFGSRVTPDGKAAKRCTDHRRVVVTFPGELAKAEPTSILLRVPQSSLRSMRNYVEMLQRNGYEPGGCVTQLSFETASSFPKLEFKFAGPLTEQEFITVEDLRTSQTTLDILRGADFVNVASSANQPSQGLAPVQRQAPLTIDNTGFGPGMMGQQPAQQERAEVRQEARKEAVRALGVGEQFIRLPDGKLFDTSTGQYVDEVEEEAEAQPDPDVIALPDGKFFHKTKGTYVADVYGNLFEPAETEKPKRTRRTKEEIAAEKAAKEQPVQEAVGAPIMAQLPGNGQAVSKPTVVAASPKLEQLLSGLAPKKERE